MSINSYKDLLTLYVEYLAGSGEDCSKCDLAVRMTVTYNHFFSEHNIREMVLEMRDELAEPIVRYLQSIGVGKAELMKRETFLPLVSVFEYLGEVEEL